MGKLFRYISDQVAAQAETGICHYCDQARTVYPITAVADDADFWDKGTEQIDELCADCIRVIPLISIATRESEGGLTAYINTHYPKGTLSKQLRQAKLIGLAARRKCQCSYRATIGPSVVVSGARFAVSPRQAKPPSPLPTQIPTGTADRAPMPRHSAT